MSNDKRKSPKILVAEDDPAIQQLLEVCLQNRDSWKITCVDCGAEAVNAWTKDNFDLIVMDIEMPSMSGLDAARQIRDMEKKANKVMVPIIALTANHHIQQKCKEFGMNACITKPFRVDQLISLIEKHLSME
jgi:CheY-like chemotaxis protein